jgi:hypothetical protein
MADHEGHAVADQLRGGGDRLVGIAEVVDRDQLHLLAEHAAGSVDVGHGQLRATLQLRTGPGILPRHRAGYADQNLGLRGSAECGGKHDDGYGDQAAHEIYLLNTESAAGTDVSRTSQGGQWAAVGPRSDLSHLPAYPGAKRASASALERQLVMPWTALHPTSSVSCDG